MLRRAARGAGWLVALGAVVGDPLGAALDAGWEAWRRSADPQRTRVRVRVSAAGDVVSREVLPPRGHVTAAVPVARSA